MVVGAQAADKMGGRTRVGRPGTDNRGVGDAGLTDGGTGAHFCKMASEEVRKGMGWMSRWTHAGRVIVRSANLASGADVPMVPRGRPPITAKHCQTLPKFRKVQKLRYMSSLWGHCQSLPNTANHCQSLPKMSKSFGGVPRLPRGRPPITANHCQSLPKMSRLQTVAHGQRTDVRAGR